MIGKVYFFPPYVTCAECGSLMQQEVPLRRGETVAVIRCPHRDCVQHDVPLKLHATAMELQKAEGT